MDDMISPCSYVRKFPILVVGHESSKKIKVLLHGWEFTRLRTTRTVHTKSQTRKNLHNFVPRLTVTLTQNIRKKHL